MLTFAQADALLSYDPETGEFRWKVDRHKHRAGALAGTPDPRGYLRIKTGGKTYQAARLAVLLMTGGWPAQGQEVDHRDLDKGNYRWGNLRVGTKGQNRSNVRVRSHSKSGVKGVTIRPGNTFQAYIKTGGRRVYLGSFKTKEAAHAAYMAAALKHHGEFARSS